MGKADSMTRCAFCYAPLIQVPYGAGGPRWHRSVGEGHREFCSDNPAPCPACPGDDFRCTECGGLGMARFHEPQEASVSGWLA